MKLAILGSCVTRDAFEAENALEAPCAYVARAPILSLMGPRPTLKLKDPPPEGWNWRQRMVVLDVCKTAIETLKEARPDFLILDFIDERLNVKRYAGGVLVETPDAGEVVVDEGAIEAGHVSFEDRARETLELLPSYVGRLLEIVPESHIVVHGARLAKAHVTETGSVQLFANPWYDRLDEFVGSVIEGVRGLAPAASYVCPTDAPLAGYGHRWGPAPFHYVDPYYTEFNRLLRQAV